MLDSLYLEFVEVSLAIFIVAAKISSVLIVAVLIVVKRLLFFVSIDWVKGSDET